MIDLLKKYLVIILIVIGIGVYWFYQSSPASTEVVSRQNGITQPSHQANFVIIKYRSNKVDIVDPRFETVDTSESSFVRGAWYDAGNSYMVINLSGTYYHYCGMPSGIWEGFKGAGSFGSYYNSVINGRFDCRYNPVPEY